MQAEAWLETIVSGIDLVAQLVEQMTLNHWVVGSTPTQVTQQRNKLDLVAQLVEQMTLNHWVVGSTPTQVTRGIMLERWQSGRLRRS